MAVDITPVKDGGVLKELLLEGTGEDYPGSGSIVRAHYHGTLEDGTVFDSSVNRGEPFEFTLGQGQVIKAWDLGVATMKKGEKAKFTCQSNYAYGKSGSPPKIPGDATLIFEITLLSWKEEDLSKDGVGGITRTIITQGDGFTHPAEFRLVKIHLKGFHGGAVFDDREISFTLGEGCYNNVPIGVEHALQKMKKGEKSRITLSPRYGWSDGNPHFGIPPGTTLKYEISLLEFEKDKESWDMDTCDKLSEAELFKSKATEYFQKGNLAVASQMYAKAESYIDSDAGFNEAEEAQRKKLLLAIKLNLGLVSLKLNDFYQAKNNCDNALQIDPVNVKALFRRGQAYLSMGEPETAKVDFEQVVKLEPTNSAALAQINVCKQKIKEIKDKEKKIYSNMFDKFARKDNEDIYRFGWWDDKQKHPLVSEIVPEEKEDIEEKKREKKKQLAYLKKVAEEKRKEREAAEMQKNVEKQTELNTESNREEINVEGTESKSNDEKKTIGCHERGNEENESCVEEDFEKRKMGDGETARHDVSPGGVGEGHEGQGADRPGEGEPGSAAPQQ